MILSTIADALQRLALFLLPGPKMLWCSVSVGVFLTDNAYLQYMGFGYHFELYINGMLWNMVRCAELCGRPTFAGAFGPCLDAQLFTAFFGFVATHVLCYGNAGLPRAKTFIGFACFATMALSLVTMGTCGVASVMLGAAIGVASGALRVILYRALIGDPRERHKLVRAAWSIWRIACDGEDYDQEAGDDHDGNGFRYPECIA